MFEMLFGGPPFSDDHHDPAVTSARVMRWRQHFHMPSDPVVSSDAQDLIRGLICDPQDRLTADSIRAHSFFKGLDFRKLREMEPPIRPVVTSPLDTSNFDDFSGADAQYGISHSRHQVVKDPSLFAFHDYGYRRDLEAKKPSVTAALSSASVISRDTTIEVKTSGGATANCPNAGAVSSTGNATTIPPVGDTITVVSNNTNVGLVCVGANAPKVAKPVRYLSPNGDVVLADTAPSPSASPQRTPLGPWEPIVQPANAPSVTVPIAGLQQLVVADQRHQQPPLAPTNGAWGPRVGTTVYQANNFTTALPSVRPQGYPLHGPMSLSPTTLAPPVGQWNGQGGRSGNQIN